MTLPRRRRCMGFVRSPAHDELWTPCLHYALPQNILCASHLEGLEGSLLGLANVESQQRFRHVIHLQHRTRNAYKRRRHRAGAIEGDRAVRESYPHLEKALREVLATRSELIGVESHEIPNKENAEREEEAREEIHEEAVKSEENSQSALGGSVEEACCVLRRSGEKAAPLQAHETR